MVSAPSIGMLIPDDTQSRFQWWVTVRMYLSAVLCVFPFMVYEPLELLTMWRVPVMAILAASIPASGAPVAGGIIFLPVLQTYGVCPRDAVAFSALTQFFGCGIFSPLNWLVQDPTVFLPGALRIAFLPSLIGLLAALSYIKVNGCHGDHVVLLVFAVF